MARGFGIAATEAEQASTIAREVEALGYASLWTNDTPAADGLVTAAALLASSERLDVGVGVLPLDRRSPAEIAQAIDELGLDRRRLIVGVGSGFSTSPLEAVEVGVQQLRESIDSRIAIAAMGPRMCRLAGKLADVVLLNWMTPDRISSASKLISESEPRDSKPVRAAYVRLAIGSDAPARLRAEAEGYTLMPHYQRAMGPQPGPIGIAFEEENSADRLSRGISTYEEVLDLVILRALPQNDNLEEILELARRAAP